MSRASRRAASSLRIELTSRMSPSVGTRIVPEGKCAMQSGSPQRGLAQMGQRLRPDDKLHDIRILSVGCEPRVSRRSRGLSLFAQPIPADRVTVNETQS